MGRMVECNVPKPRYVRTAAHKAKLAASQVSNTHSRKHGYTSRASRPPEYTAWINMRSRCNNPNHPKYSGYGARGITVCDRWEDFALFLADVGPRPDRSFSIDRIDNDGNYEPGNVRWATRAQQQQNQRRTVTPEQVEIIRSSALSNIEVARLTGVSADAVSRIRLGKCYS